MIRFVLDGQCRWSSPPPHGLYGDITVLARLLYLRLLTILQHKMQKDLVISSLSHPIPLIVNPTRWISSWLIAIMESSLLWTSSPPWITAEVGPEIVMGASSSPLLTLLMSSKYWRYNRTAKSQVKNGFGNSQQADRTSDAMVVRRGGL